MDQPVYSCCCSFLIITQSYNSKNTPVGTLQGEKKAEAVLLIMNSISNIPLLNVTLYLHGNPFAGKRTRICSLTIWEAQRKARRKARGGLWTSDWDADIQDCRYQNFIAVRRSLCKEKRKLSRSCSTSPARNVSNGGEPFTACRASKLLTLG